MSKYNTHQANGPCQQDHNLGNAVHSLSTVARTACVSWQKHCQDCLHDPIDCRMHTHGEGLSCDATLQKTPTTYKYHTNTNKIYIAPGILKRIKAQTHEVTRR